MDTIKSTVNVGANAVKNWSDEKCKRVYRAALRALRWGREEHAAFMDRVGISVQQTVNLCRVSPAQAWTSAILSDLQSERTATTVIPASPESREWSDTEGGHVIHDQRAADEILREVMRA